MKRNPKNERTVEQIIASGIAKLSGEAPQLVPLQYVSLYLKARDGRLNTFGSPESVNVTHLQEQFRNGFPPIQRDNSLPEDA